MIRSAVILGAISFIYMLVANVAMVLCAPFLAIILGMLAGALAAVIDKPQLVNKAAASGAIAGGLAGIGAVIGNTAGLLIRTFVVFTPQTITDMITDLTGVSYTETEAALYSLIPVCCCAITDLILMAAAGALGGFLWMKYQSRGKTSAAPPQALP
ncbi:MAG: hypothetical protein JW748_15630 [Anaerolineales bacterium]|nr:hypothetical protein [Anaerolineales bacterium]